MSKPNPIDWLTPSETLEESKVEPFRNIAYLSSAMVLAYALFAILFFPALRPGVIFGGFAALSCFVLGFWAARRRSVKWPALALTIIAIATITSVAAINGGVDGHISPFFAVAPLLAGFFLGARLALACGLATILCILGLHAADVAGLVIDTPFPIAETRLAATFIAVMTATLAAFGSYYLASRMRAYATGVDRSRELLSAFAQNAPIAAAMFDKEMRYMEVSDRWLLDYQTTRVTLIGHSHYELYPEITEERRNIHRKCLAGATLRGECDRFERKDGSAYWLAWEVRPWLRPNGKTGGLIMITRDVTEQYESRKKLEDSNRKAEAASEAKSAFLANMSHEIRTPLNGVLGMAHSLEAEDLTPRQHEKVRTVIESGEMLLAVVNDILDLSKIEAGKIDIDPVNANIRGALDHVMRLFQPLAEEKGLSFDIEISDRTPARLSFDTLRIRQCLSNLISNAIKFTQKGGVSLRVDGAPQADGGAVVRIDVTDTGIGIDDEARKKLFTAFSQGDASTSRRFGGTGLGLAIVRMLAQKMDGDVTLNSAPGEGSTFTFTFRAGAANDAGKSDEATVLANPCDTSAACLEGTRILVVDDNQVNRMVARSFLESCNAGIAEAQNGKDALTLLVREPFDLVLLDIHMPVLDGPSTFAAIRKIDRLKDLPVIALTADAVDGDAEKYLAMGMSGYVAKPVAKERLIAAATSILRNRRASAACNKSSAA